MKRDWGSLEKSFAILILGLTLSAVVSQVAAHRLDTVDVLDKITILEMRITHLEAEVKQLKEGQ
ncbi:hypothetical protein [Candidatus Manganitrophus noduliformans]|uniref:Uncharacterized protein n=1 Tax=Candidatus Manganitrophus noduliformans TaxID=2606439 RepID=A0A7X6DMH5_9BACT|nr:hypothetical protein [Candidatus Manganitrophus noduliformans]NKE69885.1 hypothetical protein [Candidatus Manganitrophus noduliformans]